VEPNSSPPTIHIQAADLLTREASSLPVDLADLERAARLALESARPADPTGSPSLPLELSLVLTDDAALHDLNREYLDIDAPTDVLAFPAGESDPDSQALYLGDVVISYERAQEQATAGGHSLQAELRLLVVHGVLHLLGHDHADEIQKAAMWSIQAGILSAFGSPVLYPMQD
jgi:probable rRNA maturation factor